MKMAEKMSPSTFSLEMCAELCCGAASSQEQGCLLAGDRSNACSSLPALHSHFFLPQKGALVRMAACVKRQYNREYGEGAGVPGDPAPYREGKEDQVPALGTTNIREVLQGQASCLQKVSLASAYLYIQMDTFTKMQRHNCLPSHIQPHPHSV